MYLKQGFSYIHQGIWSCVSNQERRAVLKCVIYRNCQLAIFNILYLCNY